MSELWLSVKDSINRHNKKAAQGRFFIMWFLLKDSTAYALTALCELRFSFFLFIGIWFTHIETREEQANLKQNTHRNRQQCL